MPVVKNSNSKDKEFIWGKNRRPRRLYIVIGVVIILAVGLGYLIFGTDIISNSQNTNSDSGIQSKTVYLDGARRAIDGVKVESGQENHYPVAVMIENLVAARPQAGLAKANLVYEALVEGGITRFMAVYAGELAAVPKIGPVRSARPYFLDWAEELKAMYLHAGGSPQALASIGSRNVVNLDQFYNSQYYWRDRSRQVAIEHTLYTSGEKISFALRDHNLPEQGNYPVWKFKDDAKPKDRPSEDKYLIIDFSSFNYKVEYKYNKDNNDYVRYLAGQEHKDENGQIIRVKNVVVQKVKTSLIGQERLAMVTSGEGDALVFIDGLARKARWKKEDKKGSRTFFYDLSGNEIEFSAGPTWIEVVPTDRDIEYN